MAVHRNSVLLRFESRRVVSFLSSLITPPSTTRQTLTNKTASQFAATVGQCRLRSHRHFSSSCSQKNGHPRPRLHNKLQPTFLSTTATTRSITSCGKEAVANENENENENDNIIININTNGKNKHILVGPVTSALEGQIRSGRIKRDKVQSDAAIRLDRLYEAFFDDNSTNNNNRGRISKIFAKAREDLFLNDGDGLFSFRPSWNHVSTISRRHPKHRRRRRSSSSTTAMSSSSTTTTTTTTANMMFDDAMAIIRKVSNSMKGYLRCTVLRFFHTPVRGLYIHGSVGIGKSFLMDLFHEKIVAESQRKQQLQQQQQQQTDADTTTQTLTSSSRRVHFHEFMLDVHQRMHDIKKDNPLRDALPHVAYQISQESKLLCFDEFQVTDIADAMILKRLFEFLFELNVVVVATSNRPPSKLYEGGLNRARFLPFIDTLHDNCDVLSMDTHHDYRRDHENSMSNNNDKNNDNILDNSENDGAISSEMPSPLSSPSYYWPNDDPRTKSALESIFGKTDDDDSTSSRTTTEVLPVRMGRTIAVQTSTKRKNCGRFNFHELCFMPLGAADYLAIAERFSIIIIEDVPRLDASKYNEARRFVTMIDAFYESSVLERLVISAEVPLSELFVEFEATVETNDGDEETVMSSSDGGDSSKEEEIAVIGEGGSSSSSSTTTIRAKSRTSKSSKNDANNNNNNDTVDVEWSATGRIGVSLAQLSSVKEVVFSFRRAESRLYEMCMK